MLITVTGNYFTLSRPCWRATLFTRVAVAGSTPFLYAGTVRLHTADSTPSHQPHVIRTHTAEGRGAALPFVHTATDQGSC